MTSVDTPTRLLARIYFVIWLAAIAVLIAAAVANYLTGGEGRGSASEILSVERLIQASLILIPLGILVFSVIMAVTKQWRLAATGFILTLIWVGAKLLG